MESSVLHSAFESDTVLVEDDALKVVADVLVYHLLMDNVPVSIFLWMLGIKMINFGLLLTSVAQSRAEIGSSLKPNYHGQVKLV